MNTKKILITIGLTGLILLSIIFFSGVTQQKIFAENNDLKTPESTITYFISKLRSNNLNDVFAATAVTDYCRNYDFYKITKYVGAMTFLNNAPSEYPLFVTINENIIRGQISQQIKNFIYTLLSEENINRTVPGPSDKRVLHFIESVNPARLKKLKIIKIVFPMNKIKDHQRLMNNFKKQAKMYGAEDSTERLVLYSFDGNYYYGAFHLLLYKQQWKIDSLISHLAGMGKPGSVVKTTPDKFARIINK